MKQIGPYPIVKELGRGGMGVVYQARDPILGREVAVKVLVAAGSTQEDLARFRREAQITARLRHPNIVGVHSLGVVREHAYLVIDLIQGESLQDRIDRDGPLPAREAAQLIGVLARAVDYAHAHGVLHRDLKPQNVILGDDGCPVLVDFGMAKILGLGSDMSRTGEILGTPAFMSPEQARGETSAVGPRCDVYGLGATLYAALTGRPPFRKGSVIATLASVVEDPVPTVSALCPDVDPALEAHCTRCLQKNPRERFASAAALAEALEEWGRPARASAPRRVLPAAGVLVAGVALGVGLMQVGRPADDPSRTSGEATSAPSSGSVSSVASDLEAASLEDAASASDAALLEEKVRALYERGDFEGALRLYRRAELLQPGNVDLVYNQGVLLLRLERYANAREQFSRVIGAQPDNANAWGYRGAAAWRAGDLQAALADLSRAIELQPDSFQAHLDRGRVCMKLRSYPLALYDLTRALAVQPDWRAYYYRARTHQLMGDASQALADCDRAIELKPQRDEARILRGKLQRTLALQPPRVVSPSTPGAPPYKEQARLAAHYRKLSLDREHEGDLEGALAAITSAVTLEPQNVEQRYNLGVLLLRAERFREALACFDRVIKATPLDGLAWENRVEARIGLGDAASALDDATHAIELSPGRAQPYANRGRVYLSLHRDASAAEDLSQALELEPSANAYYFRAKAYRSMSLLSFALADCDRAIGLQPQHYRALLLRGFLHMNQGALPAALRDLDAALALRPDATAPLTLRGTVRMKLADFVGAARDIDEAVRRDPNDYRAFVARARLRLDEGKVQEAIRDYERALSVAQDDEIRAQLSSTVNKLRSGQ